MKTIILDPGHGMSNRKRGVYDPGAVHAGHKESEIAMRWVNALRAIFLQRGFRVVRTRRDENDPCPVWRRDDIAVSYGGAVMLSFHCNAGTSSATGAEVFYRGADDLPMARELSVAVAVGLGIRNRGPKTEADSQHASLAVLEFDKCWLIELGFITNAVDRERMLDDQRMEATCGVIADVVERYLNK